MRRSRVVQSDEEFEAQIRAELVGQPAEWVDEEVAARMVARKEQADAAQAAYDRPRRNLAKDA